MPRCDRCREVVDGSDYYRCSHCDGRYCGTHHLPESHGCVYAALLDPPWGSKLDEANKYEPTVGRAARGETGGSSSWPNWTLRSGGSQWATAEQRTSRSEGTSNRGPETEAWKRQHDNVGEPSPDVNPDGSIAGEETARLHGSSESFLAALYRRLRLCVKTPLRSLTWLVLNSLLAYAAYVFLTASPQIPF